MPIMNKRNRLCRTPNKMFKLNRINKIRIKIKKLDND